jgi:uncharacterized LabA/DUF88 family protein
MNIEDYKIQYKKEQLNIDDSFGKIFVFIDFGNINKWFEKDNQDWNNKALEEGESLEIDIKKLKEFSDIFGEKVKIYYGQDLKKNGSCKFTDVLRIVFGKRNVITKDLQRIKHFLNLEDDKIKFEKEDEDGNRFVEIRKCNFDVEIATDSIKMLDHYDTFCIFSGDSDFAYLNNFLKSKKKKIILVKGGYITSKLRESADLVINAQQIKKDIVRIKNQKPD